MRVVPADPAVSIAGRRPIGDAVGDPQGPRARRPCRFSTAAISAARAADLGRSSSRAEGRDVIGEPARNGAPRADEPGLGFLAGLLVGMLTAARSGSRGDVASARHAGRLSIRPSGSRTCSYTHSATACACCRSAVMERSPPSCRPVTLRSSVLLLRALRAHDVSATLASDYIRTARAKGVGPVRSTPHALRNASSHRHALGLDIAALMTASC